MPLTIGDFAIGAAVGVGSVLLYQQLSRKRNPEEAPVTVHPTAVLPDTPRTDSGWYVILRYNRHGGRIQAERGPYRSEQSAKRAARRYERQYRGLVASVQRSGERQQAAECACSQQLQQNPIPDNAAVLTSLALMGAGAGLMLYALVQKSEQAPVQKESVPMFHSHEPQVLFA